MKLFARPLLLVLLPAAAATADPLADPLAAPLPRPLLVPTDGLEAALSSGAEWRAWRAGDPAGAVPIALAPTSRPDWQVAHVLDDSASSAWILVGETPDGRAASLRLRSGELPQPAAEILPPRVTPVSVPGAVNLTWTPSTAPALAGWRLQRSQDGAAWTDLGIQPVAADSAVDAPPQGPWAWRLVPELEDGVVPAVISPPSEIAWSSDGDFDDDGVTDAIDRCRILADPSQSDADGDGISDACEMTWADVAPRGAPDGVVGIADVVLILRMAVGLDTPSPAELRIADVAPALVLRGAPDRATPRLLAPSVIAVDDAVLALRTVVGLAVIAPPR